MFSKNDYLSYFEKIASIERVMIYRINDILLKVEDKEISNNLRQIVSDKIAHYAYVLTIIEGFGIKENMINKRTYGRDHFLGKVRIRVKDTDQDIYGYCVNISPTGACIELDHEFNAEDQAELWFSFYYNRKEEYHQGEFVWEQKITPQNIVGNVTTITGVKFRE